MSEYNGGNFKLRESMPAAGSIDGSIDRGINCTQLPVFVVGPGFREPSQRILLFISSRCPGGWRTALSQKITARHVSTRGIPACRNQYKGRETAIIRASGGCRQAPILVVPAAQTLERIHFVFTDGPLQTSSRASTADPLDRVSYLQSSIPLPPLPVLRTLEFHMREYWLHSLPFILDTISSVLASNASLVLTEIVMTFPSWKCRLPPETDSMATLDEALVAHRAAPLMRWRTRSAQKED
ncbi:hypothetical protein K438DRAFT_1777971 [Mycena galopus ATCC 62051]|nr:hypothetical protein K438DRAFT_1777971 [Mycena galopus ATCC 62051]